MIWPYQSRAKLRSPRMLRNEVDGASVAMSPRAATSWGKRNADRGVHTSEKWRLFDHACAENGDRLAGAAHRIGTAEVLDLVEHVHALHDLAENRVAARIERGGVIDEVEEELRRRAVGIAGTRHRDGAADIAQAVAALVLDRGMLRLAAALRAETAALRDKS